MVKSAQGRFGKSGGILVVGELTCCHKTGRHNITEILLKVVLNTINPNPILSAQLCHIFVLFWSAWSFGVKAKLWRFFYHYLISVLPLEIQLSRGKYWDSIKRFNPTTYLCLSLGRTCIFNAISWSFWMLHDWKW